MTRRPNPNERSDLATFLAVVYVGVLTVLVGLLVWVMATRRTIDGQVDELKKELADLRKQSRQWEELNEQASRDRDVLMRVLRQCRSAGDLPNFGGNRIIANQVDGDAVAFYVPEGEHHLEIRASWELTDAQDAEVGSEAETGEESWSVPLIPNQTYLFSVRGSLRTKLPIGWELQGRSEEFQSQSDELPLPPMRALMTSWSSFRKVDFPNRHSARSVVSAAHGTETDSWGHALMQIGRWTKNGKVDERNAKIYFELKVASETPPVLDANAAEALWRMKRGDLVGDYLGDGRYLIQIR